MKKENEEKVSAKTQEIIDAMAEMNPGAMYPTGFADCIVGITYCGDHFVLDSKKIIKKLMKRDKMKYEEAIEFFEFNIAGSRFSDGEPIYISSGYGW